MPFQALVIILFSVIQESAQSMKAVTVDVMSVGGRGNFKGAEQRGLS